ncbi:hypothetical protein DPMN_113442 [Dreissena polymorpha]|uniref:Uncharacterized protein n=1 Tax=Dreissena polymorpha TaxID=45954 RepID=A0A9D4QQP2_DREPO|nr:hypothetical protein DPMN_113442 [Dreissena polymorpha]
MSCEQERKFENILQLRAEIKSLRKVCKEVGHVSSQANVMKDEESPDIPENLQALYDKSSEILNSYQRKQIAQLHRKYEDAFARSKQDF